MSAMSTPDTGNAAIRRFDMSDEAPIGLVAISGRGRILQANRALASILGCESVEMLKDIPLSNFHAFPELALELLLEAVETRSNAGVEMNFLRLDGNEVTVRVNAAVVRREDGEQIIVASAEDVTDLRGEEAGTRQSQTMDAVARLAAGISHDYNNLITAILGEATHLADTLDPGSGAHEAALSIMQSARRAARITRRLLTLSQAEVAAGSLVDLGSAVGEVIQRLTESTEPDVELDVQVLPGNGTVRLAPSHLHEILTNLIANSQEAMPSGGPIRVEVAPVSILDETYGSEYQPPAPPGEYQSVAVGDAGIGMNEETRQRVFEPFFTTKGLGDGAGLGLTTVFSLVRASRGHISVMSEPAYGTLVRILFPCHEGEAPLPTPAPPPEKPSASPDHRGTVLLVDDEEPVRRVMRKALTAMGFEIVEAPDGAVALDMVRDPDTPLSLLVTDVMMPRMKGTELARHLLESRPGLPVLLVSGYTDSPEVQEWVDVDPDIFLAKPFELPDFMARVSARMESQPLR
ncbi:MAG: response regulator [Gemmatimonadota bacterium]|nr:response regulator [Gemmatimonadota bacterium]